MPGLHTCAPYSSAAHYYRCLHQPPSQHLHNGNTTERGCKVLIINEYNTNGESNLLFACDIELYTLQTHATHHKRQDSWEIAAKKWEHLLLITSINSTQSNILMVFLNRIPKELHTLHRQEWLTPPNHLHMTANRNVVLHSPAGCNRAGKNSFLPCYKFLTALMSH